MGLAAVCAGWTIDYKSLTKLEAATQHEGRGPKSGPRINADNLRIKSGSDPR